MTASHYIDWLYYESVYQGSIITSTDQLLGFIDRAEREIDAACFGRIRQAGLDTLTSFQQDRIRRAVCYQVDHLATYAPIIDAPVSNFSIGSTSMALGTSTLRPLSTAAQQLLDETGLTCHIL